jgi:hypothetical protein
VPRQPWCGPSQRIPNANCHSDNTIDTINVRVVESARVQKFVLNGQVGIASHDDVGRPVVGARQKARAPQAKKLDIARPQSILNACGAAATTQLYRRCKPPPPATPHICDGQEFQVGRVDADAKGNRHHGAGTVIRVAGLQSSSSGIGLPVFLW